MPVIPALGRWTQKDGWKFNVGVDGLHSETQTSENVSEVISQPVHLKMFFFCP